MKVSEITVSNIAEYIRADSTDQTLPSILTSAKKYITSYTGIPESATEGETLDDHEDFYIVVMILCQDMYDNRSLYVDTKQINRTVETILNMHRVNLVG